METAEDSFLPVMMEIIKMEMDAHRLAKSNRAIFAQEVALLQQMFAKKLIQLSKILLFQSKVRQDTKVVVFLLSSFWIHQYQELTHSFAISLTSNLTLLIVDPELSNCRKIHKILVKYSAFLIIKILWLTRCSRFSSQFLRSYMELPNLL